MDLEDLLRRMNTITDLKVVESFDLGLQPYNRRRPPPVVCSYVRSLASCALFLCAGSDLLSFHRNLLPQGLCRTDSPALTTTPTASMRMLWTWSFCPTRILKPKPELPRLEF